MTTKCSSDKIDLLEHNVNAYKDRIEYVEDRNSNLIAIKESLILSEEQAREELEMTKKEMKDLKKQLNDDIAYIAKLEGQLELKDTVWMKPDTVYKYDEHTVKTFNWSDQWTKIGASVSGTNISDSRLGISSLNMDVPLTIGLTDDYKFFATSTNPYVNFTDIQGAVIHNSVVNEKEKRLHHGVHVGFGFQYGLFGKQWDFGPQIGYSLMLSF